MPLKCDKKKYLVMAVTFGVYETKFKYKQPKKPTRIFRQISEVLERFQVANFRPLDFAKIKFKTIMIAVETVFNSQ